MFIVFERTLDEMALDEGWRADLESAQVLHVMHLVHRDSSFMQDLFRQISLAKETSLQENNATSLVQCSGQMLHAAKLNPSERCQFCFRQPHRKDIKPAFSK